MQKARKKRVKTCKKECKKHAKRVQIFLEDETLQDPGISIRQSYTINNVIKAGNPTKLMCNNMKQNVKKNRRMNHRVELVRTKLVENRQIAH